jgi:glutaredoxin
MDYLVFTYPNCVKCDKLKKSLGEKSLPYQEYSLVQSQGKARIRDFIKVVKRDGQGAIIIPTLVLNDQGIVRSVLNSAEELDEWLKSRA